MTYEKIERDEYEVRIAEYLRPAMADHEFIDVHIEHRQIGGSSEWPNISVGSVYAPFDPRSGQLTESQAMNDGNTLDVYDMPDGAKAIVISHAPQRPPLLVPFFSVVLYDWPIERSVEEDLGPRFRKALQLLLEACLEARDAAPGPPESALEAEEAQETGDASDERND